MIDENGEWHRRLFIFDLDGTLVDSKEIHFNALNEALKEIDPKYVISKEDQEKMFEGLPTKEKLNILSKYKNLPLDLHNQISKSKQRKTIDFFKNLDRDEELIKLFKIIKEKHVDIAVASNCIRETIEAALTSLGLMDYVDVYLGNEDVSSPKPNPEIFNKCMQLMGNGHPYTTIFEDSFVGKTAAIKSECRLVSVKNRSSLTIELIESELFKTKKKINVLIPMAGEGSRFSIKGFKNPKPLIDIDGKSMINVVHDNIGLDAHYIFVAKEEHINKYNLKEHIQNFCKDFTLISQDGRLDGAAISCLLAKDLIDNDSPLLIANSDQYVLWDSKSVIKSLIDSGVEGSILTFISDENKWSYVKKNIYGMVERVAEKEVISNAASCGIYYWKNGSDFVKYAESMIKKNIKTNNEFYVCPVYNEAILDQSIINTVLVKEMVGLGTPEDLQKYLSVFSDIKDGRGVEEVSVMTKHEICVKYKNPFFKFYEQSERAINNGLSRWDKRSTVFSIPEEIDLLRLHCKHMVNPIIHDVHNGSNKSFDGRSVYLLAY